MSSKSPVNQDTFDVYAKPFIPEFLRAINSAHAPRHHYCRRTFDVDYLAYVQSFCGRDFIDDFKPKAIPNTGQKLITFDDDWLDVQNYENYFLRQVQKESELLALAQSQYDLFVVRLYLRHSQNAEETGFFTSFHVPGLSENSPDVRAGDVVHLRPLVLDGTGSPTYCRQGLQGGMFVNTHLYMPGWDGDVYVAEVTAVRRNEESIDIRMDRTPDLTALVLSTNMVGVFNVQFPVREKVQRSFQGALQLASQLLNPRINPQQENIMDGDNKVMSNIWLRRMLFPDPQHGKQQTELNSIHFAFEPVDKQLNHEQLRAVDSVIRQNYGTVPFIVHGPPGTGKTKTLVDIALQMLRKGIAKHILVCAPSDPAADTLADRLRSSLQPAELLRLNPPSRTFAEVLAGLLPYCSIDTSINRFSIPAFSAMMKYKVVVTTCRDANMLLQAHLSNTALYDFEVRILSALRGTEPCSPPPHWQALLIDEAAQAAEPEALIPLMVVATKKISSRADENPIFVMAGDQQQLGPRTATKDSPMRISLFERLLARPLYAAHPLARHKLRSGPMAARTLTKAMLPIIRPPFSNLLRNYRSHPAILAVPNALFYYETLIPEAEDTNCLLEWERWSASWPVMFVHHTGEDEIETDGGGWYNVTEVGIACNYALSLVRSDLVPQKEICVMSPFSAQVRRLRQRFRLAGLHDVNIGPMEAFQGLESTFVIVCTTRSRTRFLDQDQARSMGIIHEPKRFNVALTRAKHGLIVIGNRDVLAVDPYWRAFLDFCVRNDLVVGQIEDAVIQAAARAPPTTMELILKRSEAQAEPNILALTGELEDLMWMQGAMDQSDENHDENDSEDELDNGSVNDEHEELEAADVVEDQQADDGVGLSKWGQPSALQEPSVVSGRKRPDPSIELPCTASLNSSSCID